MDFRKQPNWLIVPCTMVLCGAAFAQPPKAANPAAASGPAAGPKVPAALEAGTPKVAIPTAPSAVVKLSEEPLKLPDIGLTVQFPEDFLANTTQMAQMMAAQISPADGSWVINISTPRTTAETPDSVTKADSVLAQLRKVITGKSRNAEGSKSAVGVIDPANFAATEPDTKPTRKPSFYISGLKRPGDRFYALLPANFGNTNVIKGVAVFQPLPDQFAFFELTCTDKQFEVARPIFELIIASSVFEDPTARASARRDAVAAGQRLLSRFTAADLEAALPPTEQTYRLHRPAASGDPGDSEELGFRSVRFWKGKKNEIDPSQPVRGDNPDGFLLTIDARLFNKLAPGSNRFQIIDTQARYFMTLDRTEELWSVRTSVRDGLGQPTAGPAPKDKPAGKAAAKGTRTVNEVGARSGVSASVSVTQSGLPAKSIEPSIAGEGYLSQLESYLLPRMLVLSGLEIETGFYTYRSDSESIALRRDSGTRDPAQGGAWTVSTRFREGDLPQVSLFRDNGDLIKATLPDGRLWEAATAQQLISLYKKKNLPYSDN